MSNVLHTCSPHALSSAGPPPRLLREKKNTHTRTHTQNCIHRTSTNHLTSPNPHLICLASFSISLLRLVFICNEGWRLLPLSTIHHAPGTTIKHSSNPKATKRVALVTLFATQGVCLFNFTATWSLALFTLLGYPRCSPPSHFSATQGAALPTLHRYPRSCPRHSSPCLRCYCRHTPKLTKVAQHKTRVFLTPVLCDWFVILIPFDRAIVLFSRQSSLLIVVFS